MVELTGYPLLVIEVQALKPSSFEVDINVTFETLQNIAATAITLQTSAPINLAKMVLDILTDVIGIKKFLGGQQPKAVKIDQAGRIPQAIITNIYGVNNTVTIPVYNALQDKQVNIGLGKAFKRLSREEGNVNAINIDIDQEQPDKTKSESVTRKEFNYFQGITELQTIDNYKLKAVVSRLDSKTGTGLLTLSRGKRITFELGGIPLNDFDAAFLTLAESLKLKIPIYITGKATLDFNSSQKKDCDNTGQISNKDDLKLFHTPQPLLSRTLNIAGPQRAFLFFG